VVRAELAYVFRTANIKKSGVSVSSEKLQQKMFIGTDTISEIVCYQNLSITVSQKKTRESKFTLQKQPQQ
jgi:hypothetical protein